MKKVNLLTAILAMILLFTSCGAQEVLEWPTSGISTVLPVPESKHGKIIGNYDFTFSANIICSSENEYEEYKNLCMESGFVIEADEDTDSYDAFNKDGYKLSLNNWSHNNSYDIHLYPPKERENISWPSIGLSLIIPKTKSTIGKITNDSSSQFNAHICDMTFDDYNAYVEECIAHGFTIDHSKGDKYYSALNENGDKLRLDYEGFNTISIAIYAAEEEENKTPTAEADTSENAETTQAPESDTAEVTTATTESLVSEPIENNDPAIGIRPEIKEAIDSYEAMMNEYCEFMKKYNASPDDMALLLEYTDYLNKYSEAMNKLSKLDSTDFNDEELKYYIEVTNRVNEKLLEASI